MQEIDINLKSKFSLLFEKFGDKILGNEGICGDTRFIVSPEANREVIAFLKEKYEFNIMMDIVGMDYLKFVPEQPERFAVVYILYSLKRKEHLHIKCFVNEDKCEIASIWDIYKAANWFEREAWDMFGIVFKGHPNLQRILCHADFVGYPLRKDYPSDQYQRLKSPAPSTGF